jgi:succinoglycan biosynthesis transport protein ExoP
MVDQPTAPVADSMSPGGLASAARPPALRHEPLLPQGGVRPASDWERVLGAVRDYKWLVVSVTLVGTAGGVVGSRVLKPLYEARALLWVEVPDRNRAPNQGPIEGEQLIGSSSGWLEVLRSHVVLDDVVREQRLYLKPRVAADSAAYATFAIKEAVRPGRYRLEVERAGTSVVLRDAARDVTLERGAVGDSVGREVGFSWVPPRAELRPGRVLEFSVTSLGGAAVKLAEQLRVRQSDDRSFVGVEWRAPDPGRAVATVNGVVERVVAVAADLKRERLRELSRILGDQLEQARRNLQDAEAALTAFRVRTATRPAQALTPGADPPRVATDPTFASYVDLRVTAAQLARDREAIRQVLAQAGDSGLSVDALTMIPAVQHSAELSDALKELTAKQAELRALRFRYADTHPPLQRLALQVDTLSRRIVPQLARTLAAGLAARERELNQRVDSVSRELRGAPPVALEEIRLERDQANAGQLFSNLQQRYDEARLAEVSSLPAVRVLERAVQLEKPITNLAPLVVVLAFAGSLSLGAFGALGLARIDRKVRNPDAVSRAMGLPILGAVPRVRRNGGRREPDDDTARAVEALRGIRLSVHHAYGAAGPLLLTVTSPGRGEGKSFVSSNLAQAFADVGYRTLLVDGDVRLGRLHRPLQAKRRPGLADVLAGNAPAQAVIQATSHPGLAFIGCGSRMHRGPELLSSAAVPRLITALRGSYDVILVDSAPLAAGVDPYALGTATGSLLLVLRSGVTDRSIAEAKVKVLQRLPIRVLGVVLNDVRPGAVYSYYAYSLAGDEMRAEDPEGSAGELMLPDRS